MFFADTSSVSFYKCRRKSIEVNNHCPLAVPNSFIEYKLSTKLYWHNTMHVHDHFVILLLTIFKGVHRERWREYDRLQRK